MFGYLLYVKPFDGKFNNRLNIYCEFVVIITFALILLMNLFTLPELITKILGWIMVCMIVIVLICIWISVVPATLKSLYKALISKPKKRYKETRTKDIRAEGGESEYDVDVGVTLEVRLHRFKKR